MKLILLTCLISAVMADVTTQRPDSVTVSGTETVPASPGGTTAGTIVSATKETDLIRAISSQTVDGQLLPSWCSYEGKDCPNLVYDSQQTTSSKEDCMRACKADSCWIAAFDAGSNQCSLSHGKACNEGPKAASLVSSPGRTLLVRRKAGDSPTCPDGAGPVGLPEDQFTSEFCVSNKQRCPIDKAFSKAFKATVEQCKYECNAYAACAEAVFILGDTRYCYLLDRPCQSSELVSDPLATTLYRMPSAQYYKWKAGGKGADICPLGGDYYVPDAGPPYTNKFCLLSQRKACPNFDGNMYAVPGQDLNQTACLSKCLVYATCGMVEWYQVIDNGGTLRNRCNMKDSPLCTDAELVDPPPQYIQKANSLYTTPDAYKTYQHYIRLKDSDNGVCPGKYAPAPGFVSWNAKYCIWYDRVCPTTAVSGRTTTAATDLNDCLTQCYRSAGGSCKSAVFENGQCTQLTGVCTQQQLTISLYKIYYIRMTDINAVCPAITCLDHASAKEGPITPNTCANPNAAAGSTILTTRCVCDDGFLDFEGVCVNKDDCPVSCPQKTPYTPVLVGTTQQTQVYRIFNFQAADNGNSCGTGATVQLKKPCANTKATPNANDNCPLPPAYSCHCASPQVWDPTTSTCA